MEDRNNRKNIPLPKGKTEEVKYEEVKHEKPEEVKLTKEELKASIKNEPEIQKAVKEMQASGMNKEEIETLLERASDTFLNKLLSAIQDKNTEKVSSTVAEVIEELEVKDPKDTKTLFHH